MEYHKAQNQWGIHLITSSLRLSMPMYFFFSFFSRYGIAKCFGCRIFFISHSRKWHVPTNLAAITFHTLKNELNASLVVVLFVCLINLFIFHFVFISLDSKKIRSKTARFYACQDKKKIEEFKLFEVVSNHEAKT